MNNLKFGQQTVWKKKKKQIYLLCENGGLGASSLGFTNKESVHVSGVEKKKEEKTLKAEFYPSLLQPAAKTIQSPVRLESEWLLHFLDDAIELNVFSLPETHFQRKQSFLLALKERNSSSMALTSFW